MSVIGALSVWTGWDRVAGAARDGSEVSPTDAHDGVRYALLALAGRGFRPPAELSVRDATQEELEAPSTAVTHGALRSTWSLAYRRVVATAPPTVAPYAIYLLGVDPPPGATDAELEAFNDFYTNVHLVEVAERRHALRAERFELAHVLRAPAKGAPRYLATYEVDEAGASQRRHVGPPYAKGPDVWQRHTTPWRLWYRRLTPP